MSKRTLDDLVEIMAKLRGNPGCPWDKSQTHETLKPFIIEEAYEVVDAISRKNREDLIEELGDLLLQIVFHSRIGEERGEFDIGDVIEGICEKMIRRHPHIFGDVAVEGTDEVLKNWEEIKKAEKAIEDATGVRPTLFRPPRGVYSSYAMELMRNERYTMVLWDVSSEDWAELPPKKIVSNIVKRVKPGSIILLHDSGDLVSFNGGNRSATVQALPLIIENLREKGYDFVTIDQMILLSELMKTEEQIYESDSGESQAY